MFAGASHGTLAAVSQPIGPMKKLVLGCVVLPGAALLSPLNVHATQIFYSQVDWENAVNAAVTLDQFNNAKSPANTITFDSGVTSTRSYPSDTNTVSSGKYYLGGVTGTHMITWAFPGAIDAFGFTVTSLNNHTSITGNFSGTGNSSIDPATLTGVAIYSGFIGVIGNASFSSIVIAGTNSIDTFSVDNLEFHRVAPPAVPDSGPLAALFASVLLGLAALRRRFGCA